MVFKKAIGEELQKNPGIRKEVEEYTDQIEQIHKRQKGLSSSSSSTMTPPQTTTPTGDLEMGVRHEKRRNDDKSDEPSDKKHRADMMNMETTVDIAEVFSPPRITAVAQRIILRSACNLDLTTHDTDGKPWDFDSKEMRNRAILKVVAEKPYVLITSPMCTDFSIIADGKKLGPAEKQRRMNRARMHLKFACTLHLLQHNAGRYFVHAHPRSASSWAEQCVIDVVRMTGAVFTNLDQCMFGLMSTSDDGVNLPSKKATTLMSNMPAIQTYMARRCDGSAFVYSQKFCVEIAMAVKKQKEWDNQGIKPLACLNNVEALTTTMTTQKKRGRT